jgi:hypothetical protein
MDCHDTSSSFHPMIPSASTLLHLVSLVTFSSSTHSTPFLLHKPWVIPQSFIPTLGAHPSHQECLCVPCFDCGHLYVTKAGLAHHHTSCTTHRQSSTSRVLMLSTLLFFHPLAWTWIVSLDIIYTFHLGLPHPFSYHHIPYALHVKVQHVLHILLVWLVANPCNIAA